MNTAASRDDTSRAASAGVAAREGRACRAGRRSQACALLLWGILLPLGVARAQAPDAAAPPAPREETPEDKAAREALERAQRLADNPMRHILRASRMQRRAPEPPAAVVASPAPLLLTLTPTWPDAPPLATWSEPLDPQAQGLTLALPAAEAPPALPRLPEQDPLVPEPEVPQLQRMVEPALDARLLDQLGRLEPVDAVLTLRQDGSVADVAFPGTVDARLRRVVLPALQQWRFAPLRTAQEHRVQLRFDTPR